MEYKRREAQNFRFRMHLGTARCSKLIDNLAMSYKNVLVKSCARMLCGHGHLLQCTVHSVTSYKHFLSRVWYNGQNDCILVANRTKIYEWLFIHFLIERRWWENVAEPRTPASLQFANALVALSRYHNSSIADPFGSICSSRLIWRRQATPPTSCNRK